MTYPRINTTQLQFILSHKLLFEEFTPNKPYKRSIIIRKDDNLYLSKYDVEGKEEFDSEDWVKFYNSMDIDQFIYDLDYELAEEIDRAMEAEAELQENIDELSQSTTEGLATKVDKNDPIIPATHTKITYDSKGLVTGGVDLQESDIPGIHLTKVIDVTATVTEVNYLEGVTDFVQTQLNSKQPNITGAATTITNNNLTKNRALISNSSGKVAISNTTSTELGYVHGVTSAIQTQIDSKVDKTDSANRVYGTDGNGVQITYDYNSFGKVDDVRVNGTSVVTNKIANLGSIASYAASAFVRSNNAIASGTYTIQSRVYNGTYGIGMTEKVEKCRIILS